MGRKQLILDRYEVVGFAGAGGFGTVQIAWDRRIQRKVAIKTIQLTDRDVQRAALPGADAVDVARADASGAVNTASCAGADATESEEDGSEDEAAPTRVLAARTPPKAQTPAEARARREAEEAHEAARREALSQKWEQPWVEVPQKAVNTLSLEALPAIELDVPACAGDPAATDEEVDESALTGVIEIVSDGEETASEQDNHCALEAIDEEFEPDEPSPPAEFADFVPDKAPDVLGGAPAPTTPTEIIAEARRSLKDLPASRAHTMWDGTHPWDDLLAGRSEAADEQFERAQGEDARNQDEDAHVTALAHLPGLDEARTAAKLSDPRIVAVYDFEVRDNVAYLIMEYIEGITLSTLLDDYADYLTIDMVTGVFDAVAGALEVAHAAGVLHLDIKPDNIIITREGQAKVTDFGLATLADATGSGFAGGGTIGYMPLEQMRRESLDARTDEWSLAALTYEMLTGSNPFRATTLAEAEQAILDAELPLPSLCWPALDAQLDDVIFYALDPNAQERYASVADFADEVDKFLGDGVAGEEQLALVVEDALCEAPESSASAQVEGGGCTPAAPHAPATSPSSQGGFWGLVERLAARDPSARRSERDFAASQSTLADKLEQFSAPERSSESNDEAGDELNFEDVQVPRAPLFQRVPEKFVALGARLANAAGAALVGTYALSNMTFLAAITGDAAVASALVEAVVFAAIGILFPLYSALVTFCLLGLSICLAGHPIVGVVLVVATGVWWYVVGREGLAENNVALFGPLAGSIGAAAITPLVAGAALKPLQVALTMAYSLVVGCVFASFGSESLLGWDIFAHASFADTNITLAFGRMFARPLTWTMAAGWLAGATAFSLLNLGGRRWTFITGLAVCVACVLAGSLVFGVPTPQLFISLIVGAVVLLAVFA